MTTRPLVWQRPAPSAPPPGFPEREAALHALVADVGRRHARAALASSLSVEDAVLVHAVAATGAAIDVFVIDTGRLHRETLELIAPIETLLERRVIVLRPDPRALSEHVAAHGAFGFYDSVPARHACCHVRKVEPLQRVLAGRDAWLTGQRRAHAAERAGLAVEERDEARGIAKYNPLAAWDDASVWHYADRHGLPTNRLHDRGFASIGCEPCTRAICAGEDPRAGRWWWESGRSKECGLHVAASSSPATDQGGR